MPRDDRSCLCALSGPLWGIQVPSHGVFGHHRTHPTHVGQQDGLPADLSESHPSARYYNRYQFALDTDAHLALNEDRIGLGEYRTVESMRGGEG